MNDQILVASIAPFFRYCVGPSHGKVPAIPFYRLKAAEDFFEYATRELPFSACTLHKRTRRGLVPIREYIPPPADHVPTQP